MYMTVIPGVKRQQFSRASFAWSEPVFGFGEAVTDSLNLVTEQTRAKGGRDRPGEETISRHIICSGQLFAQFFRSHPEELPEARRGQLQAQQAVRRLIHSVPGPELV